MQIVIVSILIHKKTWLLMHQNEVINNILILSEDLITCETEFCTVSRKLPYLL